MQEEKVIEAASKISVSEGFTHIESTLILRILGILGYRRVVMYEKI